MGKRVRGAKLRSKKRGTEAEREIVETQAVEAEEASVNKKADEELFVIDTTAIVPSKKQIAKKVKRELRNSTKETEQIQKLVELHSAETLQKMAKRTSIAQKRAPKRIKMKSSRPKKDLWADEEEEGSSAPTATASNNNTKAHGIVPSSHVQIGTTRALQPQSAKHNKEIVATTVDVAKSGQSYNPDKKQHKKSILDALVVETKRQTAETEAKSSASQGMRPETRALLLGDTDSEDESDNDNDDENDSDDDESMTNLQHKRPGKMTRAQRNKQKRVRAELYAIQERKRQKQYQHELRGVKAAKRELLREEAEKKEQKEQLERLKKESERSKGKDVYQQLANENPRYAPSYPVALPSELKSTSLRTIKPKGSLVTDRLVSLMDRGMTPKKQLKLKMRVEGKRRKVKVRGKAKYKTAEGDILG